MANCTLGRTPPAKTTKSAGSVPWSVTTPRNGLVAFKGLDGGPGQDLDAARFHVEFDELGHVPIEQPEDLRLFFHECDSAADLDERFGEFDTDQAGADDDDVASFPRGEDGLEAFGVADAVEREDVLEVDVGNGWDNGGSAGSEHEFVVFEPGFLPVDQIPDLETAVFPIDSDGLRLIHDADAFELLEEDGVANNAGRRGHELLGIFDDSGDVIG